jgi:hypothetical protein
MQSRAFLRISLLAAIIGVASIACENSDSVTGPITPGPTPTSTPVPPLIEIAGDWSGVFQADPTRCQSANLSAATASFTENETSLSGTLSATTSTCPIAVRLQARRTGNTFSGTATQLGYSGTVTGRFVGQDLIVEISTLTSGASTLPGGTAQLYRP